MAISCAGTRPPNFGMASSFPFSLTAVTTICWRRIMVMTASLESATSTPVWVCPLRAVPFHSNVGMASSVHDILRRTRASRRRSRRPLRENGPRAARDHLLQLVGIRGARERDLERDQFPEVERGQRLVEGLHPVLGLAGLHHRIDLVDLV